MKSYKMDESLNNSPKTFVELYKLGCKLSLDPDEEYIAVYQDLDDLVKFVKEHPESDKFKTSISDTRVCIVIPYKMFKDKRRLPDDIIDGQEVIFACPGYDDYVSLIIDKMNNDYVLPVIKDFRKQITWKLAKLNLALTDWNAYVERYLKPFK